MASANENDNNLTLTVTFHVGVNIIIDDKDIDRMAKKFAKELNKFDKLKIDLKNISVNLNKIDVNDSLNLKSIESSSKLLQQYSQNLDSITKQYEALNSEWYLNDSDFEKLLEGVTNQVKEFEKEISDKSYKNNV